MAHSDNAKSHSHHKTTSKTPNELKISRQEREQQDHDSEEILSEIISNREFIGDGEGDRVIFEKKYFDILPNDLDSEGVEDSDVFETAPISLSASSLEAEDLVDKRDNRRRVNSRRFRRDLTSLSRQKRNFYNLYQPDIPYNQYHPIPRQFVSDFYFPQELQYDNNPYNIMVHRRSPQYPPPQLSYHPSVNHVYYDPQTINNPYHPINNNRLKPGPTYLPPSSPQPMQPSRPLKPGK
jgi:hypothetical protein